MSQETSGFDTLVRSDPDGFYLPAGSVWMRAVQALQREMLAVLDRTAREADIQYCLIFGTLLGARRHGGFIPWDDDIDVGVLRRDYERLLAALRRDLDPELYLVEDAGEDLSVPRPYAKIRCRHTRFQEFGLPPRSETPADGKDGIFLDIFPLDNVPRGKWGQRRQLLRFLLTHFPRRVRFEGYRSERRLLQLVYERLARRSPGRLWSDCLRAMTACRDEESELVIAFPSARADLTSSYLRRRGLMPSRDLEFAGLTVQGPADVEGQLESLFGAWQELPSQASRRGHRLRCLLIDTRVWAAVLGPDILTP
ncbi:MAG: LicD family protein [Bacillota bacterium]|nr:LicD family protein [Bacillota bacterium]